MGMRGRGWQPDLFPSVVAYGLLASVLMQLWSVALGMAIWRRGDTTSG